MHKSPPPSPFSCRFTPQVPELLNQLGCTLMISTYQAGKLIFLSAQDDERLIQLPRTFNKAMGVALHEDMLALATKEDVLVFRNSPDLAQYYPPKPNTYDALYMPRAGFYTGQVDLHDIDFGRDHRLFAVNTSFSCLIEIDFYYSWRPYWVPPFITELVSEDRCHLNGMAMQDGLPRYVTAFNMGNSMQSWRSQITGSGVLMDVQENKVIAEGLAMPHSPRIIGDHVFLLQSATGEVIKINPSTGQKERVIQLDGFVRGFAHYGDYLFVGKSKLRKNSSTFAHLPIAEKATRSGITIIHLPTATIVGEIFYEASVDEIYDVQVLPGFTRPNILNLQREQYKLGLHIPTATYWARSEQGDATTPSAARDHK